MIASAKSKYVRISARKVRLVTELLKGKTVEEANVILDNVNKRACTVLKKVLNSAFANANQDKQEKLLSKDLYISTIKADGGPMLRRYRAATMGRAAIIRHRTAHLYIELDQVKGAKPQKVKKGSK
ncbi:MAG: 50S ribosomal protein L22 [Candidatus Omnitrophica bacterium]|nr:50S ribosomal protein L22 [Candidatus Omnitrophota bacterium]